MDAQTTEAKVLVHAHFAPDATVVEIGERPSGLTPQDWFFYLRENSDPSYFPAAVRRARSVPHSAPSSMR